MKIKFSDLDGWLKLAAVGAVIDAIIVLGVVVLFFLGILFGISG